MAHVIGSFLVFIGTYTTNGSKGIYVYRFEPQTGQLVFTGQTASENNPSFVVPSVDGKTLYAVSETGKFQGQNTGAVSAWRIDHKTGALTFLNRQPSGGTAPCHLSVTADGKYVGAACYGSGNVCLFPVAADGRLLEGHVVQHEGHGPTRRQQGPHAHSTTPDPATGKLYAADLGIDRVVVYDIVDGKLVGSPQADLKSAPGAGPRHLDFHPNGQWLYVINELGNSIDFFARKSPKEPFGLVQTISSLPEGFAENNTCADIHIHPNGHLLFGSNRGHDSIVCYRIDAETGKLSLVGHTPSGGKQPRNFAIAPNGRFLYAAHQESGNVVGFRLDPETGQLTPLGFELDIPKPVCVRFLAIPEE